MAVDPNETRYKLASDRFSMERDRAEHINGRASQGVAISGTLMALFLGLGNSALTNLTKTNPDLPFLRGSLVIGLLLFSVDLLIFLVAYVTGTYRTDPNPSAIIHQLGRLDETQLIRQLTSNWVDATISNDGVNNKRALRIKVGYFFLFGSILIMLVFGVGLGFAFSNQ